MKRIVPFAINYKVVNKLNKIAEILLYLSAILLVLAATDTYYEWANDKVEQYWLNTPLSIIAILYFATDLVQNYVFRQAEINRKNDFIDNSLGTKLSDSRSTGYFSNDPVEQGVYKLGVNCFENSLFTKAIMAKMMRRKIVMLLLITTLFLLVLFYTDQKILLTLLQMALPYTILYQTFKLIIAHSQIKSIYEYFKIIYESALPEKADKLIIHNVINYETTLSWACISLDSKIFKEINPKLSEDWEKIKIDLNIH